MIDTLTNDMMRLCGEIASLRENRAVLRGNLAQGRTNLRDAVSEMQSEFRNTHNEMANQTKVKLQDFVSNVQEAVSSMRQGVGDFRQKTLGDIAGARRAWCVNILGQTPVRSASAPQPKGTAPRAKKKKR
jgi:hypothetical protein